MPGTERNEDTAEPAAPRPRRRSPLTVAGVAAAVLVAGGGGAYWATAATGGAPAGASRHDPAPLVLTGGRGGPGEADDGGTGSGVTGSPPAPDGRYTAVAPLPPGPGSAPLYLPGGQVPKDAVAKLAASLGVPGAVTLDHGLWKAGDTADGGPSLQVDRDAPGTWSYARYGRTAHCEPPTGPDPDAASCTSGPADGGPGRGGGILPSEQRVRRAVAPVLAALGLSSARVDARRTTGAVRIVDADPVVGGLPTSGWRTELRVGSDGRLSTASGLMGPLSKGDVYPLVEAGQALKDLNASAGTGSDHGIAGCPTVVPKAPPGRIDASPPGDPVTGSAGPGLPHTLPCVPGADRPWEVRGAVLGLSARFVSGTRALVPSWLFDVAQPGVPVTHVVSQPAVDPRYIRQDAPAATTPPGDPQMPVDPGRPGRSAGRQSMKVTSYAVRGKTLLLRFWGGVCSDYSASATESARTVSVKVTGTRKDPGQICVMLAKSFTREVRLDGPLGDRMVVDLSDGEPVTPSEG